jgi:uncharacterized membrane protein
MRDGERMERRVLGDLRSTVLLGQLAVGGAAGVMAVMTGLLVMYGLRFGALLVLPVLILMPVMMLVALALHNQGRRAAKELKYLT